MIAYAKRVGWLIFWVAVVVLGLLVVPVMHNPGAIPMIVFSIIVLAVFSALWGTGMLGRRLAMSGAALVLALSILSFFLPLTAKRVPEKVKSFDVWLASTPTPTPPPPAAHPPTLRITSPAERPWSFRTIDISGVGKAYFLSQGWRGFTQGGDVTITTRDGRVFHDKPGVPTNLGQSEGIHVFCPDPPGSKRNMVIYNRW